MIKWLSNIWYYIRCHTFTKYHVINCSQPKNSPYNEYRWGYIDPCERIMFGLFNELVNYVEKYVLKHDPDESDQELIDIYNWWTIEHKADNEELDKLYTEKGSLIGTGVGLFDNTELSKEKEDRLHYLEDKIEREVEEYLIRLIKLRRTMWYP